MGLPVTGAALIAPRAVPTRSDAEQAVIETCRAYVSHATFAIEELPVVVEADAMQERHRLYEAMIEAVRALEGQKP